MPDFFRIDDRLPDIVPAILASYQQKEKTCHLDKLLLPSRSEIIKILDLLMSLLFPGYHGRQHLNRHNLEYHVGETISEVGPMLGLQLHRCLCYRSARDNDGQYDENTCRTEARELAVDFLQRIPRLREMLCGDVNAAFEGDPAACNHDEVILAYPGTLAIAVYRIAHELFSMDIPLMPRIMTEHAHSITGVDIHPGATIGKNFFIDHATGVVIGETTHIGNNVKIYQGVTLGALSTKGGQALKGRQRHPTIRDNVTIYANATILGGDTEVGSHSTVNGSVFLTNSVPDNCTVMMTAPELKLKNRSSRAKKS